ncbi:hypothetical protein [Lottiidibacillus patelloidae]|nr:hypothetical protein [Lottiidibacillus patelloidae]
MYYGYNSYAPQSYDYRAPKWQQVYMNLYYSLYAEQMVCALSSEFFHIDETKDLKGNGKMHQHLVPASYHRVTAVGSVIRILNGDKSDTVVKTLTSCINNAQRQDKGVVDGIEIMERNIPRKSRNQLRQIIQWQKAAEHYLKLAENNTK